MIDASRGSAARMADGGGHERRARIGRRALGALGLIVVVVAVWIVLRPTPFPDRIRLGAGVRGGTWDELGSSIKVLLERRQAGLHVDEVRTGGSADNVARIERGELDLAFREQAECPVGGDGVTGEERRLIVGVWCGHGVS